MEHSVVFAGFGGQGLLFAGQVLARAAIKDGLEVFWIPSYGPEMRGGTASCTVIVADETIGSPVVDRFDAAVAMNPPSMRKFGPRLAPGGLLLVNGSLVDAPAERTDVDEVRLNCTAIAARSGDDRLVSVVALGALVAHTGWVTPDACRDALRDMAGKRRSGTDDRWRAILDADLGAFDAGLTAAATPA